MQRSRAMILRNPLPLLGTWDLPRCLSVRLDPTSKSNADLLGHVSLSPMLPPLSRGQVSGRVVNCLIFPFQQYPEFGRVSYGSDSARLCPVAFPPNLKTARSRCSPLVYVCQSLTLQPLKDLHAMSLHPNELNTTPTIPSFASPFITPPRYSSSPALPRSPWS